MVDTNSSASVSAPITAVHTLTPINPLQSPFGSLFQTFSPVEIFAVVFALVFIVWALYSVVLLYHWFRYGRNSLYTIPLIIAHVLVSGFLFLMASSTFLTSL